MECVIDRDSVCLVTRVCVCGGRQNGIELHIFIFNLCYLLFSLSVSIKKISNRIKDEGTWNEIEIKKKMKKLKVKIKD